MYSIQIDSKDIDQREIFEWLVVQISRLTSIVNQNKQVLVPLVSFQRVFFFFRYLYLHEPMDDSTSLSSLNSADFILIGKEQPRLRVPAGKSQFSEFQFSSSLSSYLSINSY